VVWLLGDYTVVSVCLWTQGLTQWGQAQPPVLGVNNPSSCQTTLSGVKPKGSTWSSCSLVPRPPRPAFITCSTKSGGRPGRTYHVMRATADVMFSLLMSGFVLSPFTLLSLNSVCSFCSVCPASPIATGSIVASYST